jgi:hypothetical protein
VTVVIATTGERFVDFAPYVAAVNDAGVVAFQAALREGGMGVFAGDGGEVVDVAVLDSVTSHPDLNGAGDTTFYGEHDGRQGVFLVRAGRLETLAATPDFASIGPLGPTINEAGAVAFRADAREGVSGVFVADGAGVRTVADTAGPWSEFHGLPVVADDGTVVFRADREDGVEGIYAGAAVVAETGDRFATLARFPSTDGRGAVAFAATRRAGGGGIYVAREGRIEPVVEDGGFESFRGALVAASGAVLWLATPHGGSLGLYSPAGRILGPGDPLLGSTVAELVANPVSIDSAGRVAIRAGLADRRQAILAAGPRR